MTSPSHTVSSAERYRSVVGQLLDGDVGERILLAVEPTVSYLAMEDGTLALVLHPSRHGDDLRDAIIKQLGAHPKLHHKVVIIGGGEAMQEILTSCQPGTFSRRMVQVYHLDDAGKVWSGRGSRIDSPIGAALERAVDPSGDTLPTLEELRAKIRRPTNDELETARSHRAFIAAYRSIRPVVTIGAAALLLGVFGLQLTWGGGAFIPTLTRMGANTADSLGSQPWRLLASVLLHGGWLHIGANTFMLYVLGGHVERIVGWRRYVLLLVAAGLLGSVLSAFRGEAALSVGASGAIWGLLGAALGIALRPRDLVPASVVGRLKRAAVGNFVINVAISFVPGIDAMAHLGGGIAGFGLAYFGLLTHGLEPVAQLEGSRDERSGIVRASAIIAVGAVLLSLVTAVFVGRPWELARTPSLETVAINESLSVQAPAGSKAEVETPSDGLAVSLGDPFVDPFWVGVTIRPWEAPTTDEDALIAAWRDRDAGVEEGAKLESRTQVEGDGPPAYDEVHVYDNGGTLYVRYTWFRTQEVTVSTFVFADAPDAVHAAARSSSASLVVTSPAAR